MEILSPVGAKEQLIAAVRNGANAVYLGLKDFNARRNADNFDKDALKKAISYCHARNVKVYITLNTLIKNKEIEKAKLAIKEAALSGADALIVQDLAIYRIAKETVPQMPLHASTQMSIHNIEGVKALQDMGFSRVVPARELSLKELEVIAKGTDIELEVFVHGALCMCVSGQCYLSSVLGQRSANRGLCAQPCRLNFKSEAAPFALSLKDLSIIKDYKALEKIGIHSLKIEGRMKRPEYVAAATNACALAKKGENFSTDTLKAIFSRSGFTDGYLTEKRNRDMFGYRTKEDVVSAAPILKSIANTYHKEMPLVPVDMKIEMKKDKPLKLTVTEQSYSITVTGDIPEKAISRETSEEMLMHSLEKCGGTPYFLRNADITVEGGLSVPLSAVNALRKQALEELETLKGKAKPITVNDYQFGGKSKTDNEYFKRQKIFARFENPEQITEGADKIILDYEKILRHPEIVKEYKDKLVAELPSLMFDTENTQQKLLSLKELGITEAYAPNLYAVYLCKKAGLDIIGGYGLNILNDISLDEYRILGVKNAEISFEITLDAFDKMQKSIPCGLIVYGKMPLMTFRNCPAKSEAGCGNCKCKATILDRYNNPFTVLCKDRLYGRLLNPCPIYMGDKKDMLKNASFLSVYFTDEDPAECLKIMNRIKSGAEFDGSFTRGLYFKEIY